MIVDRKLRACFLSVLLLFSSLSIVIISSGIVKAATGEETKLYFHDKYLEEVYTDEDIISAVLTLMMERSNTSGLDKLAAAYMSGDENFSELDMIIQLLEILLENPRLLWFVPTILEIDGTPVKILDTTSPTKTVDSTHPSISVSDNTTDALENQDVESILDLITSLAPFPGVYIYQGEEVLELDGEIDFSLYFSTPITYLWNNDKVDVTLCIYSNDGINEKYNKTTILDITRLEIGKVLKNPAKYDITFQINNVELNPNDIVFIEINRDSGDKKILEGMKEDLVGINITEISESLYTLGETLASIPIESLSDLGIELMNISENLHNLSEELDEENLINILYNITIELISSSFVYDSVTHDSFVSLPCNIAPDIDTNIRLYYLTSGKINNILDENVPENEDHSTIDLKTKTGVWNSTEIGMSKILKSARLGVYLNYRDLLTLINLLRGKIKLHAALYAGEKLVATSTKELEKTTIFGIINDPTNEPVMFDEFTIKTDEEITWNTSLKLEVYADNNTQWGIGLYRDVKLLFGSKTYQSFLRVDFEETDNINMTIEGPSEIAAADSAHYLLNITSNYNDTITINPIIKNKDGKWEDIKHPDTIKITEGGYQILDIYVNSTAEDLDAYSPADTIKITFDVYGKTGRVQEDIEVTLTPDKVEHNVEFTPPTSKEIKRRKSDTYHISFVNNNTGLWNDNYTINASSNNGFNVKLIYNQSDLENVEFNKEIEFDVKLTIPKETDATADLITITVEAEDRSIFYLNITTEIPEQSVFEIIYDFFDSVSESLGLDSILGDYAVWFLVFLFLFLIIIFLILILYFALKKHTEIVCLERIKEITPDSQAEYGIAIHNPSNQRLTYEAYVEIVNPSDRWDVSLDTKSVIIEPKQSYVIVLTIKPTDMIRTKDWVETKVTVIAVEKQKTDSISTVTTISDEKPELKITGVLHWPKVFSKGDRVVTSFRLENRGKVAANKVRIILYLNGEEKNKVEDITIPSGGYADIEIPWIAVKGKNDVDIVVE